MSWIDKELRRRQKQPAPARAATSVAPSENGASSEIERIAALWEKFEEANRALPDALRLQRQTASTSVFPVELAMLTTLLKAGNGACIGFSGRAIRYFWPKPNPKKSNNFWIRAHPEKGYLLNRRIKPIGLGAEMAEMAERRFNEGSIDHILRCLVTGKRVSWRSVCKRRLWLF